MSTPPGPTACPLGQVPAGAPAREPRFAADPAIAALLVDLGVDLHGIATHGSLQAGIAHAMQALAGRR